MLFRSADPSVSSHRTATTHHSTRHTAGLPLVFRGSSSAHAVIASPKVYVVFYGRQWGRPTTVRSDLTFSAESDYFGKTEVVELLPGGREVKVTDANKRANASAAKLRGLLNEAIVAEGVPWAAYGTFAAFHIFTNPKRRTIDPKTFDALAADPEELKGAWSANITHKMRLDMMVNGVDINSGPGEIGRAHV